MLRGCAEIVTTPEVDRRNRLSAGMAVALCMRKVFAALAISGDITRRKKVMMSLYFLIVKTRSNQTKSLKTCDYNSLLDNFMLVT